MQRKRGEGRFIFFEGLLCTRFYDTGARCVHLVNPRPIHLVLEILQRELLPHCKAKETEAFVLRKMRDFGKVLSLRVTCLRFSNRVTAAFRIDAEWQGQKQGDQLGSQGRN